MTDIREKVARAIAEAENYISGDEPITFAPLKWDELDEPGPERENARRLAEVALLACDYQKMREALKQFVDFYDGKLPVMTRSTRENLIKSARSALGEDKT
jgi:hypothetical protein